MDIKQEDLKRFWTWAGPAIAECGLNSYSIKETEDKCRITQDKMIRANFRRVL